MVKIYLDNCCLNRPFDDQTADVLLTTDDRLLKLAKRFSKKLHISVVNPLAWLEAIVK